MREMGQTIEKEEREILAGSSQAITPEIQWSQVATCFVVLGGWEVGKCNVQLSQFREMLILNTCLLLFSKLSPVTLPKT